MSGFIKKSVIWIAVLTLAVSCSWEVPPDPFEALVNEEVTGPMLYLDEGISSQSAVSFSVTIPEEVKTKITSYEWTLQNIFGLIIAEGTGETLSLNGLSAEEYTIILKITDADEHTRSFSKSFVVLNPNLTTDLTISGIIPSDDLGSESNDGVTSKNGNLTIEAVAAAVNTAVTIRLVETALGLNYSYPATTDAAGAASVLVTETLADGVWEVYLIKNAEESVTSYAYYLTIDTQAPLLEWFNSDDLLPGSSIAFAEETLLWSKIRSSEPKFNTLYSGNYSSAQNAEGFDPYVAGTQNLTVTTEDRAGNSSNSINRSLTVSPPTLAPLTNAGFEDSAGLPNNSYSSSGGAATGWSFDLRVRYAVGLTWSGTASGSGEGPFRVVDRTFSNYFYSYVRNGYPEPNVTPENTSNNILWFSENFYCGFNGGQNWYTKTWGTAKQEGFNVYKGVKYRLSAWTMNGLSNRASPAARVIVSGPAEMQFDTDGDTAVYESVGAANAPSAAADENWEQVVLDFITDRDGPVSVGIEKVEASGGDGGWSHFDNISFTIETVPSVTP